MNLNDIELPSNRKFGWLFTAVFFALGLYMLLVKGTAYGYVCLVIGAVFLVVTLVKPDILLPLNKAWMKFGLLLGMIVSPIVMGIIFFVIFTPIGFFMRLMGRDELQLKLKPGQSHWKRREADDTHTGSFSNQF